MYTANTLTNLENQPLHLTEDDLKDPYGVLKEFFSFFRLQDIREILWEWLTAALSTDAGSYNTGFARSNLIFTYEKLELVIEASHALLTNKECKIRKGNAQLAKGNFSREFLIEENLNRLALRSEFINAADLMHIIENLVKYTQAEKIYVVDYRRGMEKERSFDMLVVHSVDEYAKTRGDRVKLPPNLHRDIFATTIWSEHHKHVRQSLQDGHIFFSTVCRQPYLLYDTKKVTLPAGSLDLPTMVQKAKNTFELHHSAANAFISGARHFTESGQSGFAASLLLRSVEQNLLGLLHGLTPYSKTGHLGSLMLNCSNLFPQFWKIFPRETSKDQTIFELLCTAYHGAKINGGYQIDAADLSLLTDRVNNVHFTSSAEFQRQLTALEQSLSQP